MSYFSKEDIKQIKNFIRKNWDVEVRYQLIESFNKIKPSESHKVFDKLINKCVFSGTKNECMLYIKKSTHPYIRINLYTNEKEL